MAKLPLEGIRVIDLNVIWAGTYATKLLADWGAEVIKVESRYHFQVGTRTLMLPKPPQGWVSNEVTLYFLCHKREAENQINKGMSYFVNNRNKYSMTVDLRRPEGKDIFKRLVKVSDVLVENNDQTVLEKLGLTYDVLKEINPRLIVMSMPSLGCSGPYRYYRLLGAQVEDLIGLAYLRGYTDEDLGANTIVYHSDQTAGATGAFAVLMALHHRNKTGEGQFIDLAQAETALPYLGEAFMDYSMNKRVQERMGNRDIHGAVQGCYRCKDVRGKWGGGQSQWTELVDSWVNITISNEEEWQGFCRALGNPDWTKDEKFSDPVSRLKNHDELDRHIEEWTRQHDNYEVMHILQTEGVPAGPVIDEKDAHSDPHIRARGFFEPLEHPLCGTHPQPGIAFKMSKTPNSIRFRGAFFGEHNEYVYKQVIGVSDEEYAKLEEEGHIGSDYDPSLAPPG